MESDESLLVRSVTDSRPFEALVDRHTEALYRYLTRRVSEATEDVLSEVWLAAYAGRHTYDPSRGPARGWLFGIARNSVVNHLRRPIALPFDYESRSGQVWDEIDERIDAQRAAPALYAAIRALPEVEREVLLMIALDGLSPTEVATALGIPAGTVRSRLHRARTYLREQMATTNSDLSSFDVALNTSQRSPGVNL